MKKVNKKPTKEVPQYDNVRAILNSAGNAVFGLEFIKRGDGSLRKMAARLHVLAHLKGGEKPYDAKQHNLITVFEMQNNKQVGGYKAIPVENIKVIKLRSNEYKF